MTSNRCIVNLKTAGGPSGLLDLKTVIIYCTVCLLTQISVSSTDSRSHSAPAAPPIIHTCTHLLKPSELTQRMTVSSSFLIWAFKFCLESRLLPQQVRLMIRGGSCSCPLRSGWREARSPAGSSSCSPMTRCTPGSLHMHMWLNTHLAQTHLPLLSKLLSGDKAPGQEVRQTSKMNLKTCNARVREAKERFRGVPKQFMPSFTFSSPSPKGVIYISTLGETSGNYSRLHNYSLIHVHNTLLMLRNPLALNTN